jgi:hypothetical protein
VEVHGAARERFFQENLKMRRNLCWIGVFAILGLGLAPAAASADADVHHTWGRTAHAYFENLDSNGCISSFADVYLFENQSKTPHAPSPVSPMVMTVAVRYDQCQSVTLSMVYSFTFLSASDDYSFGGGVHSAHVSVTTEGTDFITGAMVPVVFDLDWEGFGNGVHSHSNEHFTSPNARYSVRLQGVTREATATGSVVVAGELMTPAPATEASLHLTQQGTLLVTH